MSESSASNDNMEDDIEESAKIAIQSLLPTKSKDKYEKAYRLFEDWSHQKGVTVITEAVLLAYFEQKSRVYQSSTLWSLYSMIRTTLSVKKNIDIKKFPSLIAFLKRKSVGHRSRKSSVLRKSEVEKFLKEADDKTYLMMKVKCNFHTSLQILKLFLILDSVNCWYQWSMPSRRTNISSA